MTDSLVARLREAIDETEQVAKSASGWSAAGRTWRRDLISCVEDGDGRLIVYGEGTPTSAEADHIVRHDPAAVLRRCAADRKILDEHRPWSDSTPAPCEGCGLDTQEYERTPDINQCPTLLALADGYALEV